MSFIEIEKPRVSIRHLHHRWLVAYAEVLQGRDVDEGDALDAMFGVYLAHAVKHHGHDETIEMLRKTADVVVCARTRVEILKPRTEGLRSS